MKQHLSLSVILGYLVTVSAFLIGFSSRSLQRVGDMPLAPGYWIPEAYWGGVHDPLQVCFGSVTEYHRVCNWRVRSSEPARGKEPLTTRRLSGS